MVLRNGKKLICLKLRRDPTTGLEWTDYSGDSARPERWYAPHQPDNYGAGDGALSVDDMLSRKQVAMTMDGQPINQPDAGQGRQGKCCDAAYEDCPMSEYCDEIPVRGVNGGNAYNVVTTGVYASGDMAPIQTIPQTVLNSQAARAGIDDVMGGMNGTVYNEGDHVYNTPMDQPYAAAPVATARNRRVTPTATESIAVELGANANIATLEEEWEKIYSQNEDVLKGYEPYYSVDATADGDVRELFRLRVGPVKSIRTGDTLCRKLGRRGFSCSVVRIQ